MELGVPKDSLVGSLISAGGITTETDIMGNVSIEYDYDIASAWQELEGLVTTSSSEPTITWGEQ